MCGAILEIFTYNATKNNTREIQKTPCIMQKPNHNLQTKERLKALQMQKHIIQNIHNHYVILARQSHKK